MKVLVFNVKYSENLGDGILARCLEDELSDCGGMEVETLDLAGRRRFGEQHGDRRLQLRLLAHMPAVARRVAVKAVLGRSLPRLKEEWQRRMAGADAVVIGGGNLFQDDDLNFPLKVAAVLDCAREAGLPVAVHAVGVGRHWSRRAASLFGRLRHNRVVHVSLRDTGARDNWMHHFGDRYATEICPDPGLLAHGLVGLGPRHRRGVVAVCVTHPLVLMRHAGLPRAQIPMLAAANYSALALALADRNRRVLFFTNGATEDQQFLEGVMQRTACESLVARGLLEAAPRPRRPEALATLVAGASAVVAHRLHACILAYALGRPHVGLGWDPKVEHFFAGVGRSRYFLSGAEVRPANVADLVLAAIAEGIEAREHALQLAEARQAVARLAERLHASR